MGFLHWLKVGYITLENFLKYVTLLLLNFKKSVQNSKYLVNISLIWRYSTCTNGLWFREGQDWNYPQAKMLYEGKDGHVL